MVDARAPVSSKWNFWILLLGALVIYGVFQVLIDQRILNSYSALILYQMCLNVILAVSLNLINGFTGQFSIGHAGFAGVGAYVSAVMTTKLHLPFPAAVAAACLAAAVAGLVIGIPTLRLKGDYLAITTLGFGEIIRVILINMPYVGGAAGMTVHRETNFAWLYFSALLTVVVIANFVRSRHGRACIAVRENEIAAEMMGLNVTYYKVLAFTIGALFAGLAGALSAHTFYFIKPNSYGFLQSFNILVIVVLGGLGSITGSILGAVVLTLITAALQDYPEWQMVIYSLILILIMIFRPQGLMGTKEFRIPFARPGGRGNGHVAP
ncbi:MAG: branched-chain amino acid ABC transporter permease [Alicyclobacillaceae bacterium]|nr:branched-chain amino acid ABC transporter permease [Alicyclobacillaceae bacterium]